MGKKISIILLAFVFTSLCAFADNVVLNTTYAQANALAERFSRLSYASQDEFLKNQLFVEPYSTTSVTTYGSSDTYFNPYFSSAYTFYSDTSYYDTSLSWRPHLGYNTISKYDFFDLTGQEELKQKWLETSRAIDHRYKVFMGVGGTLVGVGGVLAIVATSLIATSDWTTNNAEKYLIGLYTPGCLLIAAGLITMLCWKVNAPSLPNVNIQVALGLANQYNDRLMSRLEGRG